MTGDLHAAAIAVLDACRARGLTLATAESCTGGLVAGALTEIAGSSDVVDRGFVTYSNDAKQQMLGVPADTLKKYGAVSAETAEAMARGALADADIDLSVADHRHRRPRRRQQGQARWPRAFRLPPRATAGSRIRKCITAISGAATCGTNRCCRRWRC